MKTALNKRAFQTLCAVCLFAGIWTHPVEAARVVHYDFNGSGTSIRDLSPNNYDATIVDGTTTGIRGAQGSGLTGRTRDRAFDNRNSGGHTDVSPDYTGHVSIPNTVYNSHVANSTSFTVSFWMNPESTLNSSARIVSMHGLQILGNGAGGLKFNFEGGVGDLASSAVYAGVGSWEFVALSYDSSRDGTPGNERVKIYRATTNLSLAVQDAGSGNGGITLNESVRGSSGGAEFVLGNIGGNLNRSFDGLIDDFRIYDTALTQADIEDVRASSIVPEPGTFALISVSLTLLALRRKRMR